jgi:hypothetical protein
MISLAELNSQQNNVGAGHNCSIVKIVFVERTKFVLSPITAAIVLCLCFGYVCVLCRSAFSLHHLQTLNIGGTLVTKYEFWRNPCAGKLYFLVQG